MTTTKTDAIRVTCHDHRNLITGKILRADERGCDLATTDMGPSPAFGYKANLIVNLLDEGTRQSMNVSARFARAARVEGRWVIRLSWSGCPEILG
jgi:hypothetical protein